MFHVYLKHLLVNYANKIILNFIGLQSISEKLYNFEQGGKSQVLIS